VSGVLKNQQLPFGSSIEGKDLMGLSNKFQKGDGRNEE
jgi:hypothetical protein